VLSLPPAAMAVVPPTTSAVPAMAIITFVLSFI
jgi:hypothetical protein